MAQKLYDNLKIKSFCALEIEWYLLHEVAENFDLSAIHEKITVSNELRHEYINQFKHNCANIPLHSASIEVGDGQVEAALQPTCNIAQLLYDAEKLQQIARQTAQKMQLITCFEAKPFPQAHGNGLHIHIHLEDFTGQQLFWLEEGEISEYLGYAIAGLLTNMQLDLPIFAGSEHAMQRYQSGFNAPTNISWGFNNRTTALRLPDNVGHVTGLEAILQMRSEAHTRRYKRIEHRVPSAEADLSAVLEAILTAIYDGITNKLPHPAPIHGNAYDAGYELISLTAT